MGLFRLLFRALFASPTRRVEPRKESLVRWTMPTQAPTGPWLPPVPAETAITVVKGRCHVVDGDTIAIDRRMIRLAGIDAPELDHPYGKNAKWALIDLCRGQVIEAVFDGSLTYERNVATCYLPDGRDLSAEMVRLGHAIDWRKYSGGKYRHLETADARKRFWRADARQKGMFPPTPRA